MSCIPLPKAAKPIWANQLALPPCLVVYVMFQVVGSPFCVSSQHQSKCVQMVNIDHALRMNPFLNKHWSGESLLKMRHLDALL